MAEQFGLFYDDRSTDDEACEKGSGQKPPFNSTHQYDAVCRNSKGTDLNAIIAKEHPCIFPFYYKDKRYDSCGLLEASNFIVPVWRCPTKNITTKYKDTGINHFRDDLELINGYCYDVELAKETCDPALEDGGPACRRQLDPEMNDCLDRFVLPPFSTCKSDCPGGENLLPDSKVTSSLQQEALESLEEELFSSRRQHLLRRLCFPSELGETFLIATCQ